MLSNKKKAPTAINYLVILAYIAMITTNALANILPINGVDTGEVSDSYPNLFAPAGLTFSIWGVIYFLLALYAIYQWIEFRKTKNSQKAEFLNKIGLVFIFSCLANILWILSWHNFYIGTSTLLIFSLLISLIIINQWTRNKNILSKWDKLFIRLPFSIYFGWITVASIANVTALLVDLNWGGWGLSDTTWTIIILLVGVAIALATMISSQDIFYGLTIVWAYFGIGIKHYSASGFSGEYPLIMATVVGAMAVLVIGIGYVFFTRKKKSQAYY